MKFTTIFIATLATVGSVLIYAQATTGIEFKSKSGDLSISNISDQLFEGDPATNTIEFEFSGNPLRGRSSSQKVGFTSKSAKGQIKTGSGGTMFLQTATLGGGVIINQNPGSEEEVILKSDSVILKEAANRSSLNINFGSTLNLSARKSTLSITSAGGIVTLSGSANTSRVLDQATLKGAVTAKFTNNGESTLTTQGLLLNQRSKTSVFQLNNSFKLIRLGTDVNGKSQTFTLTGSSGSFTTPDITKSSAGRPITSAAIKGRVVITFSGQDGKNNPIDLTASGDRMTMDAKGEILLIGNVKIEGSGLDYQSDGESQTVYVQVDENLKPVKYGARGNPTRVNVKPDGGGN